MNPRIADLLDNIGKRKLNQGACIGYYLTVFYAQSTYRGRVEIGGVDLPFQPDRTQQLCT
jgi:hypothetical protein